MKYMHFNSSCSYAGLANLLELKGVDTEDDRIAGEMYLPYFLAFDAESECYQAGPMLQTADWFNLYLLPRGFRYVEKRCPQKDLGDYLDVASMLGLRVSEGSKHAVVFLDKTDGIYQFLNNRWEYSSEPERLELTQDEVRERTDETVVVGHLEKCEREIIDFRPRMEKSVCLWKQLRTEIHLFCGQPQSSNELFASMNRLFRPLLLDGISMMQLLGQAELTEMLQTLQGQYLNALKERTEICLADRMDMGMLDKAIDRIVGLINAQISRL